MSARGRQLNDVPCFLGALPFESERIGSFDAFKKSMWPHDAGDRKWSQVVTQVKKAVFVFKPGYIFTNVYGVFREIALSHSVHSPRPSKAERLRKFTQVRLPRNELVAALPSRIDEPLLNNRRTEEPFRRATPGTFTGLVNAANDNWHPLEAA